jgi:hypothetical protein
VGERHGTGFASLPVNAFNTRKEKTAMSTIMNIDPWGFLDELLDTSNRTFRAMRARAAGRFPPANVFIDDNAAIIFNDEGKINGSRLNRVLYDEDGDIYDVVAGTFIVAGLTTEDFGSLTEEQLKKYAKRFRFPEVFVRADDNILAVVERNGVKQLVPLLS